MDTNRAKPSPIEDTVSKSSIASSFCCMMSMHCPPNQRIDGLNILFKVRFSSDELVDLLLPDACFCFRTSIWTVGGSMGLSRTGIARFSISSLASPL